jgi:hypothetical protein
MIQQTDLRMIRSIPRSFLAGLCLWPVLSLGQSTVAFETAANDSNAPEVHAFREIKLSPGATEVARLIGVTPLLERLQHLSKTEEEGAGSNLSPEALTLRQQITEAVLGTSLEVDGVIAEIDNEVAQSSEIIAFLASRRDHAIGVNALSNIVSGGGLGIAGSALQLNESTNKLGNAVGIAAGSVTTVLSVIGLRQQHGGRRSLGIAPNMLAKIFDRPPEFHSDYPEEIWNYLNNKPPSESGSETRRQRLIKRWTELGRMESLETPNGQQKVDFLTSSVSSRRALSIDLLADREAMLSDVRASVSLMKRDLGKLVLALRTLTTP